MEHVAPGPKTNEISFSTVNSLEFVRYDFVKR